MIKRYTRADLYILKDEFRHILKQNHLSNKRMKDDDKDEEALRAFSNFPSFPGSGLRAREIVSVAFQPIIQTQLWRIRLKV